MLIPHIDWNICQACESCQARSACTTRAIIQIDPGEVPYIELDRCTSCGKCILACICQAIDMSQNNKSLRR